MSQSRRRFLKSLAALPGAASLPDLADAQAAPRDVYQELGVRPLINAAGTYTYLSASLMPKAVVEAMESASRHYVNLGELHAAVGKRISALLGCEAALVTSGAASALLLGTAGCVAGKDKEKIQRLPDTAGMKNEVVIPKADDVLPVHEGLESYGRAREVHPHVSGPLLGLGNVDQHVVIGHRFSRRFGQR